jgi:hypothetical protein
MRSMRNCSSQSGSSRTISAIIRLASFRLPKNSITCSISELTTPHTTIATKDLPSAKPVSTGQRLHVRCSSGSEPRRPAQSHAGQVARPELGPQPLCVYSPARRERREPPDPHRGRRLRLRGSSGRASEVPPVRIAWVPSRWRRRSGSRASTASFGVLRGSLKEGGARGSAGVAAAAPD